MSAAEVASIGRETEVSEKAKRRTFTAEYKRRIDALLLASGKGAIDMSLMTGLKAKGFTVMMAADTTPAAMATGKALVVISSTTSRGNIDAKFKDAPVPIIVMKDGVMKTLGMTGADIVRI